jgi:hypothetical protein
MKIINAVVFVFINLFTVSAWPPLLLGQTKPIVRVPFVGCKCYGQSYALLVPKEPDKIVQISAREAAKLAYYKIDTIPGVLAPRGWSCMGVYDSGGIVLVVLPQELEKDNLLSVISSGIIGPAVQVRQSVTDTSARIWIAQVIARVFPEYKSVTNSIIEMMIDLPASDFPFGPFPADKLTYKSDRIVEYQTPANSKGLGTMDRLKPDGRPIQGVAILKGEPDTLMFLGVRLPADMDDYGSSIIQQVERENVEKTKR